MRDNMENLGFGLGLRPDHYHEILDGEPHVDWFEIITENFLVPGGKPHYFLQKIGERYPLVMHGVSLSIGSSDPIDFDYLANVKKLKEKINARWLSDHLCWTGIHKKNSHDLLPMPLTEEALDHVIDRVKIVQDYLGHPILLENPSTYVTFTASTFTEWDFLKNIVAETGCYLLLDINNIYVSAYNHEFSPETYIENIPSHAVKQFHLAGHSNCDTHIIDTHDAAVIDPVWSLYEKALAHFGSVSTMIERDGNIPPLAELIQELDIARSIHHKYKSNIAA